VERLTWHPASPPASRYIVPLPTAQVLQYGTQIASALDKAHRNGVTHRDLKPGNIILTKAGAKLLDFGLAKAEPSASMGKTLTSKIG
jgi:serine/threonine protein kinase